MLRPNPGAGRKQPVRGPGIRACHDGWLRALRRADRGGVRLQSTYAADCRRDSARSDCNASIGGRPSRPHHDRCSVAERRRCCPACRADSSARGSGLGDGLRFGSKKRRARGEDIQPGDLVLAAGRRLRPQDLGVLSSIGVDRVPVYRRPQVRIVITGNELLPSGSQPTGSQIVDSNGPMLSALVRRDGGQVDARPIIPDREAAILEAMRDDVDVILVSGGSSVGIEDYAPRLLAEHGELAFHGVAMRPSSPAGLGRLGRRLVFLLPGNPVSCLCAYDFFAGRAIRRLGGRPLEWPYRSVHLPLRRKLVSQIGRVDYARVCLIEKQIEPVAISGASMLTSTTRADGFVIIPQDSEGYPPGSVVKVHLYDG